MTFKLWFRPALLVFFWMVVAAFTMAELATLPPALASAGREPRALQVQSLRGRGPAVSQRSLRP
jgi:hypothetical protein